MLLLGRVVLRVLVVPTSDWLGHPFPSRLHHIFERIAEHHEVHVLRFGFYPEKKLTTKAFVHEIDDIKTSQLALYYSVNALKHYKAVREILKEYKIDTVVISNLLSGYVAAKAAQNVAKLVYDLPDYFPASGCGYYFDINSLPGKIVMSGLEKILQRTLKLANHTVACSHMLMDYAKQLGISDVSVIPNGVDDFFWMHKYNGKAVREKYELDGYITLGYLGSIEFWLDIFPLLHAIHKLTKDYKVKLFLIGGKLRTKTAERLQRQIKNLGMEKNVVWLQDFIPYHDVPRFIAAMDICTIPFNRNDPTAYYSAPNKLWEYLALEKPVITTPIPDAIIQARNFVDIATTSDDYQKIIKDYIRAPEKFQEKAKNAKQFVRKKTWTNMAERYEHLLASI
jgi:glycosyltransferase involved in cell wall biosynthesis